MSTRTLTAASLAALLVTLPLAGTAHAEETSPFTANVGLVSDYAYRGWSQTDEKMALQGGFDYAHSSGLYAGAWGSNVSWLADADDKVSNSLELDLYAGYKGKLGDFGYDVGLLQYYYPGSYPKGFNSPNTLEGYVGVSWEFLTFKYSYAFTDLFGAKNSDGSQYFDLGASYEVMPGLKVAAHIGRQKIENGTSYNDWKLGVTKSLGGFDLGLHYVDTDVDHADLADERVILSISRAF
ncbi:MAG: porin [Betaproteobacteria bacterium]|nr:MAG: porin [Betaproteobacteria bacterium]